MNVYSDIEEERWAADRFRSPASAHPKRIGATMESDFTPINVEIPDGPIDTFMGRRKRLQLDASEVGDAATLASLASLGAERLDWSRSAAGDTTDE